jgi:hypothetical protein
VLRCSRHFPYSAALRGIQRASSARRSDGYGSRGCRFESCRAHPSCAGSCWAVMASWPFGTRTDNQIANSALRPQVKSRSRDVRRRRVAGVRGSTSGVFRDSANLLLRRPCRSCRRRGLRRPQGSHRWLRTGASSSERTRAGGRAWFAGRRNGRSRQALRRRRRLTRSSCPSVRRCAARPRSALTPCGVSS